MEEYLRERELLIAEDRSLRVDADAFQAASDIEKKATEILRRIRAEEHETVWGRAAPEIPGAAHVFPGMEFLTGEYQSGSSRALVYAHILDSTRDNLEDEAFSSCSQSDFEAVLVVVISTHCCPPDAKGRATPFPSGRNSERARAPRHRTQAPCHTRPHRSKADRGDDPHCPSRVPTSAPGRVD